jgi:hypothetical protein
MNIWLIIFLVIFGVVYVGIVVFIIIAKRLGKRDKSWWHEKGKAKRLKKLQKKKTWSEIKRGDSQANVASMIGRPNSVENRKKDSGEEIWTYDCGSEGKRTITFQDGFIEKIEVKY